MEWTRNTEGYDMDTKSTTSSHGEIKAPSPGLETLSDDIHNFADKDGQFRPVEAVFRSFVSASPNAEFPAEKDRYALYIHYSCPWACRCMSVRLLKGLEDIIQLIELDDMDSKKGWMWTGKKYGPERDPLYGFKYLQNLYFKADPGYKGRFTVPVLWDKKKETIVSNESSEIIRMLYSEFDEFLPVERREATKGKAGLFPKHLRPEIEAMNEWVYDTVNSGVYKCGFATTQNAYDEHIGPLFASLDRLEAHLEERKSPYLFGDYITEADIRLYPTLIRFDPAYVTIFRCNLKMIRWEYPRLHNWLRRMYWDESERTAGGAFKKTTKFDIIKWGHAMSNKTGLVPAGPVHDILPL